MQPTLSTAPALPVRSLGEPALLIGRDLWYAYDGHPAVVRGVNLALHRGLVTMMLGRSGSGKTTLLKLLAGLLRPEQGRIEPQIQGLVVSYIPQALGLVRSLSAMENTLVGALDRVGTLRSLVKAFPAPIAHEARQLLARLGLQDKLHEPVARLSGGERQRVAIARALMRRPHVILADEFVSQLDAVTTREILSMMRWLAADGVAVLTATHDADLAAEYADRVAVMASGRLVCERPASELTAVEMLGMLA